MRLDRIVRDVYGWIKDSFVLLMASVVTILIGGIGYFIFVVTCSPCISEADIITKAFFDKYMPTILILCTVYIILRIIRELKDSPEFLAFRVRYFMSIKDVPLYINHTNEKVLKEVNERLAESK